MMELGRISNPPSMQSGVLLLTEGRQYRTQVASQLLLLCARPDARPIPRPRELCLEFKDVSLKALELTSLTDS
jgi:hypothetical protein